MTLADDGEHESNHDVALRAPVAADLPELFRLTLSGLGNDDLIERVGPRDTHPFHSYVLAHGRVVVASRGNEILGYASAVAGDGYRILSQVFVQPAAQSSGIGRMLVDAVDTSQDRNRLLVASADARAVALYIRRGYVPAWPVYTLRVPPAALARISDVSAEIQRSGLTRELVELDALVTGRRRIDAAAYWSATAGASPYLIEARGDLAGYSWIHDPLSGTMRAWFSDDAPLHIGPVGATSSHNARESVLTTLKFVQRAFPGRGASIEIGGPHPALPDLLRAGARIVDAEMFMSNDAPRFGSPMCYVPSGGVLY